MMFIPWTGERYRGVTFHVDPACTLLVRQGRPREIGQEVVEVMALRKCAACGPGGLLSLVEEHHG